VSNFFFCDPSFQGGVCDRTVDVGEEVAWEGSEGVHTITECADEFSQCPKPGGQELGIVLPGSLILKVFGTPQVFEYFCQYHPEQMRGRILVLSEGTETPAAVPTGTPVITEAASPTAEAQTSPVATQTLYSAPEAISRPAVLPAQRDPGAGAAQLPAVAPATGGAGGEPNYGIRLLVIGGLVVALGGAALIALARRQPTNKPRRRDQ
jgi:hypothetical protein